MRLPIPLRVAIVFCVFAAATYAQIPRAIIVFKAPGARQTSATTLEPFQPGFGAEVEFNVATATTTLVQLVGQGVTITLPRSTATTFYLERYFADEAAMNRAIPSGNYMLQVSGGVAAPSSTPITIRDAVGVTPPLVTNFDALQSWSDSALTVTWQPITGARSDDIIQLGVWRGDTAIYLSPGAGLPGTATSATATGLNVAPGETVFASVTYIQLSISTANSNSTIVGTGSGFYLWVPVTRALPARPAISIQPREQTIATGSSVAFSVGVGGASATYQWRHNGAPITGATSSTFFISNAQSGAAGFYAVDVTSAGGSVTSTPAQLTIVNTTAVSRIANLAIRSQAGTGAQTLIVGVAIGGSGTTGTKPVLVRGVGPTLGAFGVTGALGDPKLELFSGPTKLSDNDDWSGNAQIAAIASEVGAFALSAATSKDAALYNAGLAPGAYTVSITGNGNTSGIALAEIYDSTPVASYTATTPRLTNVSARTSVGLGSDILIAGFVVSGETAKTMLIRAIGPTLGTFGVAGTLANPKLEVFAGTTKVGENDDWGGDAALATTFDSVGAFRISNASRDAALLVTLPPGNYTAQVSGVGNTTGVALVEVYEVP